MATATGAAVLVEASRAAGVEVCFANPGTTEMPLVAVLDRPPGMRAVLCLFEGVCTGAADGWGRMTGRPAATLLHLGPGLANGIANLHNARRARTPVVNWIGDHPTRHLPFDAPLTSDIAALAGTVGWTRRVRSARAMGEAGLAAVNAALGPPGRVASLIIPADCQWEEGSAVQSQRPAPARPEVATETVAEAARLLRKSGVLFLGGDALGERGLRAAARVASATGCGVLIETFVSRQERGRHLPDFPALPYFPDQARPALAPFNHVVLAGAREPVAFFAYPNQSSRLLAEGTLCFTLADPDTGHDASLALEALADEVHARAAITVLPREATTFAPAGQALDPDNLGRAISAFTPDGAIVVNEAATTGMVWSAKYSPGAAPHTMLGLTGGSIGIGLPLALGAALACPDRRVIAFQADGSGLYTLQALWTLARESANVTVVVCANRRYRVLQTELAHVTDTPGPTARSLTELSRPAIDWADLARGFGVPGRRVQTDTELAEALTRALAEPGPTLVEAVLG